MFQLRCLLYGPMPCHPTHLASLTNTELYNNTRSVAHSATGSIEFGKPQASTYIEAQARLWIPSKSLEAIKSLKASKFLKPVSANSKLVGATEAAALRNTLPFCLCLLSIQDPDRISITTTSHSFLLAAAPCYTPLMQRGLFPPLHISFSNWSTSHCHSFKHSTQRAFRQRGHRDGL